ncbi:MULTISPECIES: flagellar basal-body MS-ring/collar protein FliF [Chromobacterium]|uniref:flagellar basal-body MS-ring/collar protein FliF n=1 Tax=Chromobacterium TaxID=535 RepID=UPI000D3026B0|nr:MULTISPECIES: flagellar basal-body MS-ring/collar protein FliF [Chromobacterium]PTU68733.1 flagellar M-ring protein FliF [Chromobacterium haemolyticum]
MVDFFKALWQRSSGAGRALLVIGALAAVALPAGAFWWSGRTDYQVLFADLDARDAASVVAALEKQKTPYQLTDEGKTVQVEKDLLYKTRMKLLGGGLDLKSSVGFELFNNAEFGVTEFAQKINYLRALQGELARTIMGFDEVQNARVHLVLPEGGMLRKRGAKAKSSVWVTLKGGKSLQQEQVSGIQRLVAASVPEMDIAAVTVLDQRGVALSARAHDEEGVAGMDAGLQLKKETEAYLADKVSRILDTALGPNQAAVSVDVALDLSSHKLTRESVIGDGSDKGILVRRKEQWQGDGDAARLPPSSAGGSGGNKSLDAEYQVGRELRQTSSGGGAVKHISVGIVTNTSLSDATVERLREVISMAVGLDSGRGDGIAFSVLDNIAPVATAQPAEALQAVPARQTASDVGEWILWGGVAVVLALGIVVVGVQRRRAATRSLTESERERLLRQVQRWLAADQVGGGK